MNIKTLYWLIAFACGTGVIIAAYLYLAGRPAVKPQTAQKASAQELLDILAENPDRIAKKIGVQPVELSMPTDGKGLRVMVRVKKGQSEGIPNTVTLEHRGKKLEVPLEILESYEEYKAR